MTVNSNEGGRFLLVITTSGTYCWIFHIHTVRNTFLLVAITQSTVPCYSTQNGLGLLLNVTTWLASLGFCCYFYCKRCSIDVFPVMLQDSFPLVFSPTGKKNVLIEGHRRPLNGCNRKAALEVGKRPEPFWYLSHSLEPGPGFTRSEIHGPPVSPS